MALFPIRWILSLLCCCIVSLGPKPEPSADPVSPPLPPSPILRGAGRDRDAGGVIGWNPDQDGFVNPASDFGNVHVDS